MRIKMNLSFGIVILILATCQVKSEFQKDIEGQIIKFELNLIL